MGQMRISGNSLGNLCGRRRRGNFRKFTCTDSRRALSTRPLSRPIPQTPCTHPGHSTRHRQSVHMVCAVLRGRRCAAGGGAKGRWCRLSTVGVRRGVCMWSVPYVYVWACSCIVPRACNTARSATKNGVEVGKFAGNLSGEVGKREKKCTLTSKEILIYPKPRRRRPRVWASRLPRVLLPGPPRRWLVSPRSAPWPCA